MGLRLVTNEQYFDYHKHITGMRQQFDILVEKFITAYQWEVQKAQAKLGSMFDASEYPSVDSLRSKFHFDIHYMPLPEQGNFVADMFQEHAKVLNEEYEVFYNKQLENAMSDLWHRLVKPLENMSKMIGYTGGDKPTGFRDTLVSNVTEVAKLLKTCNINNDPEMQRVYRELNNVLRGVTPDSLRIVTGKH